MEETDVRYATGLVATDPFFLLVDGSRRHLLVSALEAARARRTCPAAILHTPADLFGDAGLRRRPLNEQLVALVRQLGFRRVSIGPFFPYGAARALRRAGIALACVPGPAFPARAVKSAREIACIARSQRAAVAAVRAAVGRFIDMFTSMGGLMAERVTDLVSVRDRVVARVAGAPLPGVPDLAVPSVVVARDLAPADTAALDLG